MGRDGRKTKEKEVMHIVKNAVWFAFYCVQVRVCKKAEPVQVVGLADWLTTDLMDSRSPPPLITKVTAVCTQPAGAVLSARNKDEKEKNETRQAMKLLNIS